MHQGADRERAYVCPMRPDIRQRAPGRCLKCGVDLLPEGTRFGTVRHIISSPLHLVVMAALMLAVMVTVLMMR